MKDIPVYVTRHTAGGETGTMRLSPWAFVLLWSLLMLNALLWGFIGICYAVLIVLRWFDLV